MRGSAAARERGDDRSPSDTRRAPSASRHRWLPYAVQTMPRRAGDTLSISGIRRAKPLVLAMLQAIGDGAEARFVRRQLTAQRAVLGAVGVSVRGASG